MLRQRRARVVSEELREGSDLFSILAHLPVQVRAASQPAMVGVGSVCWAPCFHAAAFIMTAVGA